MSKVCSSKGCSRKHCACGRHACVGGLCDDCNQARLASTEAHAVWYGPTAEEYRAMTPAQRREVHPDDRPDGNYRLRGVWIESDGTVHDVE